MRYTILDGFRGFFLLFMGIIHLNDWLKVTLGKLNHHYFGWVEDAQGFVFISGLVVGLVYGGIMVRHSVAGMRKAIYRRCRTIYSHQVGLIAIFLVLALCLSTLGLEEQTSGLKAYLREPVVFTLASLGLVTGSMHMGILPMYIWFMLITPFALVAMDRGYTAPLVALSALLWMYAQTGLGEYSFQIFESWFAAWGHPIRLGIFFNVFGWQVLFFSGLYIGLRLAKGTLDLSFLKAPQYTWAFYVGCVAFVGFGLLDRLVFDQWISQDFSNTFLSHTDRGNFSVIYLMNFFLVLFLVTWLLVAGREAGNRWIAALAQLVHWIFTRKALVFLGQHSLHVFSYHILMVYAVVILMGGKPVSEATGTVILILGAASLYLAAWGHAMMQKRDKLRQQAKTDLQKSA